LLIAFTVICTLWPLNNSLNYLFHSQANDQHIPYVQLLVISWWRDPVVRTCWRTLPDLCLVYGDRCPLFR